MSIHIVPKRDAQGNIIQDVKPFAAKAVESGSLFRRKHGFKSAEIAAGQSGTIELVIPYNQVKINEVEFTNAREGDTVDFKVHDTPTGTISTIPNYMLNQFGFDAELPNGLYRDKSDYDADLILNMKIVITYKNNGSTPHIIRGNITYHEVKA